MKRFTLFAATILFTLASLAIQPSGTLPVIYINTDGGVEITSKEDYVIGTYYLDPMGNPDFQAFGTADAPLPLQIKGRGNYTWIGFDKKPYRLKLDSKAALLGMKKSKHFVLLAGADDNKGFMRNPVGFQLSRLIGMKWTPTEKPCELVLNGQYRGLYFLCANIRVDADRVNIVEQADNITDPEQITGGWLVEIDNYDTDPHIEITEGDGERIIFTYKTPEILSTEQADYLTTQMSTINSLIYDKNKENCQWAQYVDLQELAKFYIIQELTDNYESFHGSCYLHKDLGQTEKWYFGPVWDFGSAFNYKKTRPFYEGREHHNTWIPEMCRFPEFMEIVKQQWQEFYTTNFSEIYDYIDTYAENIRTAVGIDYARWPAYGNQNLDQKTGTVKALLRGAATYMCELFGPEPEPLCKVQVYFQDNDPNPWNEVYVFSWDPERSNETYFGSWPGTKMTPITYQDKQTWFYTLNLDIIPSPSTGIIFNNGNAGKPNNQTEDLIFENNKIYDRKGVIGDIAGIDNIITDTPTLPAEYFDITGRKITNPTKGLYLRKTGNKIEKIIIR